MLDFKDPWYTQSYPKAFFGGPQLPISIIDDHIAAMRPGEFISAADPPERVELMIAVGQHGRWSSLIGTDRTLFPFEMIKTAKSYPPLFIYHGRDDSAVPVEGTPKFVEAFKQIFPENKVLMKIEPGNHGFDSSAELSDPWLKEGLEFVAAEWLK